MGIKVASYVDLGVETLPLESVPGLIEDVTSPGIPMQLVVTDSGEPGMWKRSGPGAWVIHRQVLNRLDPSGLRALCLLRRLSEDFKYPRYSASLFGWVFAGMGLGALLVALLAVASAPSWVAPVSSASVLAFFGVLGTYYYLKRWYWANVRVTLERVKSVEAITQTWNVSHLPSKKKSLPEWLKGYSARNLRQDLDRLEALARELGLPVEYDRNAFEEALIGIRR